MKANRPSRVLITITFALLASSTVWAARYKVIYSFPGGTSGNYPHQLISDAAGNLYGVTQFGGSPGDGWGLVFKLSLGNGGTWNETVLYQFTGGTDGGEPVAVLTMDSAGNIYGTTSAGGDPSCNGYCGVVFELTPNSNGLWTESVLHSFTGTDGYDPQSGVTFDSQGNLYGTTANGGQYGYGAVYQLSPNGDGTWTESVLHSFGNGKFGGIQPNTTPVFDATGNLYGTTSAGGDLSCGDGFGCGTLFELSPQGSGWFGQILGRFHGKDGATPNSLTIDASGNLFGATLSGGVGGCQEFFFNGCGTVFELSPVAGGSWRGVLPHIFRGMPSANPVGVVSDGHGNLYGATLFTGTSCNAECGTVFELAPAAGGGYTLAVLHEFQGGTDGYAASDSPVVASDGNVYGATQTGGDLNCGQDVGCGVIYQITP